MPAGYSLQHDLEKSSLMYGKDGEKESSSNEKPILLIIEDSMDIRMQLSIWCNARRIREEVQVITYTESRRGAQRITEVEERNMVSKTINDER